MLPASQLTRGSSPGAGPDDSTTFFQGLYCVSVNCMDNAEAQFTTALRVRCRPSLLLGQATLLSKESGVVCDEDSCWR
ncbi:hypothetical protein P7K49_033715 [Saguinus oedipus]|uniref:Uncharacterized protein n=1 Tax=Saguinus oedipus TaxID=9490 RepID=A0ABQ9TSN3_SAGOE|nr:hypothetical protein P7K49_033715 [Saguinus oedipus]